VVGEYPVEYPVANRLDRTALRLRQRTERRVFRSVRNEQEEKDRKD